MSVAKPFLGQASQRVYLSPYVGRRTYSQVMDNIDQGLGDRTAEEGDTE